MKDDLPEQLNKLLRYKTDKYEQKIKCAKYLACLLDKVHLDVKLVSKNKSAPAVLARSHHADKNSILFYSHYDVKPAGNLQLWKSDPFSPTVTNGRIYARGSGDAKGQLFSAIAGFKKASTQLGSEHLNVKFLFEGEEENGSLGLHAICQENQDFLKSQMTVILDTHWFGEMPIITFGSRGHASFILKTSDSCCDGDLHAGNYGGIYVGAAEKMIDILYHILNKSQFKKIFFAGVDDGDDMPLLFPPSITICGIESGNMIRSLIPSTAAAHIDMRFVNNQDVDAIIRIFINMLIKQNVEVLTRQKGYSFKSITQSYQLQWLKDAVINGFSKQPVITPYSPAFVPCADLSILGSPVYVLPLAQHDEHNHAPNENMLIEHLEKGLEVVYHLISSVCLV